MRKRLKWCFGLKDGLRLAQPSERLARAYVQEALSSLKRAETNLKDGDLLWASVVAYYAEYYALYAFLQRIGIACENHACSILAATVLLGEGQTETIREHKGKRIDAQYHMKLGKETEVREMLTEAKSFVSVFSRLVADLTEEEIESYRKHLARMKKLSGFKDSSSTMTRTR